MASFPSGGVAHLFDKKRFTTPTDCIYCGKSIWGLGKTAYQCSRTTCGLSDGSGAKVESPRDRNSKDKKKRTGSDNPSPLAHAHGSPALSQSASSRRRGSASSSSRRKRTSGASGDLPPSPGLSQSMSAYNLSSRHSGGTQSVPSSRKPSVVAIDLSEDSSTKDGHGTSEDDDLVSDPALDRVKENGLARSWSAPEIAEEETPATDGEVLLDTLQLDCSRMLHLLEHWHRQTTVAMETKERLLEEQKALAHVLKEKKAALDSLEDHIHSVHASDAVKLQETHLDRYRTSVEKWIQNVQTVVQDTKEKEMDSDTVALMSQYRILIWETETSLESMHALKHANSLLESDMKDMKQQLKEVEATIKKRTAVAKERTLLTTETETRAQGLEKAWTAFEAQDVVGLKDACEQIKGHVCTPFDCKTSPLRMLSCLSEKPKATDVVMNTETTPPTIKHASPMYLVERLTQASSPDMDYQKAFLLTYRSFITPKELMFYLCTRFCVSPDPTAVLSMSSKRGLMLPIQMRVLSVLKFWIENHLDDFAQDASVVKDVRWFLSSVASLSAERLSQSIISTLDRKLEALSVEEASDTLCVSGSLLEDGAPEPILPEDWDDADDAPLNFLTLDPIELARQITLHVHAMYRRIEPKEFCKLAWSKANKHERAPNVLAMIDLFNRLSNFVCSEIVMSSTLQRRVDVMKLFISAAYELYAERNYDSCIAIIAALGDSSVHRLKTTWSEIGADFLSDYEQLKGLLDSNFKRFRDEFRHASTPCIPYLGIYLTDLTFMEEGNPDFVHGLVNFGKLQSIADRIRELDERRQGRYNMVSVPRIQRFLASIELQDYERLYKMSLRAESRKLNKFFQ